MYKRLNKWNKLKTVSLLATQQLFKVYTNNKVDETKVEIVSEKEPTVKEFRAWMKDIDNDLKTNVVIVFDNFDRLPKKHILNVWSSIHIFFAEEPYSRIKVIIPFDRSHVQYAFDELNNKGGNKVVKFGDDYVNKTFDIVFRITLPIMSDWKKFFQERWAEAFDSYEEEELRLVIQVYEFLNRRITPREIISFINEIITIKLLDNNFRERYIAIFVLRKDEILDNPLQAVTELKEILGGLTSFYSNDAEYAKQLTAIVYHIEVESALELIYRQELKDSMIKKDIERFNSICKADFIDSQFISVISEIEVFENPILTLDAMREESKVSKQFREQAWEMLYNKVFASFIVMDKLEIDDWQKALLKSNNDNRYLDAILKSSFKLVNEDTIYEYLDLINDLEMLIDVGRVKNGIVGGEVSASIYMKLLDYVGKEYVKFKIYTSEILLDKYLSEQTIDIILKFKNTKYLSKEYDFKKYRGNLKANVESNAKNNNIDNVDKLLVKLKEIRFKKTKLNALFSDSQIYTLYTNNSVSELPIITDLIAIRIVRGSEYNSSYKGYFTNVLNTEDEKRAKEIGNTILNYIDYDELLLLSNYYKNSLLFKQIIKTMFSNGKLDKRVNIIKLMEKYSEIKSGLGVENNELLVELSKWSIDQDNFNLNNLEDVLIEDCFKYQDLNISKVIRFAFNNDFKEYSEEAYNIIFKNEDKDCLFKYFVFLDNSSLTKTSLNVFGKLFLEKLRAETLDEKWWKVLNVYESNNDVLSVSNTLKDIRACFLNSQVSLNLEIAKKIIPLLIKYDLLIGQSDIFRLILKNEFLNDDEFIKLIKNNHEKVKTLYQSALSDDKVGFRNTINEKRDSNSLIEEIAKLIDIRKGKVNKTKKDE
ncbi:P-loop NTPase fold protein [Myroides profundi]|uniref:KAP family P-loop domain-containing protein n=1 Tax=Myroides profundi TaxID=480520 RepID=A0AAJ5BCT5_MYRPR|nr:P-loop NTPase fold protein [Myroides profundi]SEQ21914.1 KAP family P-loop domain-containing protein [Myroides profundi]